MSKMVVIVVLRIDELATVKEQYLKYLKKSVLIWRHRFNSYGAGNIVYVGLMIVASLILPWTYIPDIAYVFWCLYISR